MNYLVGLVGLGPYKWVSNAGRRRSPRSLVVDTWEWTPLITLHRARRLRHAAARAVRVGADRRRVAAARCFWRITLPLLRARDHRARSVPRDRLPQDVRHHLRDDAGGPGFASETLNVSRLPGRALFYFHIGYASSLLVILFALVLGREPAPDQGAARSVVR
jgi:multiple sugar transport system permease protein